MTTATRSAARSATPAPSARAAAGPNRRRVLWVIGALAIAFAVAMLLALTRSDEQGTVAQADTAASQSNDVLIDGSAIPELEGLETAVGVAAPQASGVDFRGEPVTLLEPGVPTVIGFFTHWCPHCQTEVDQLSKHLNATGLPDDVNVVAVSTAVDSTRPNFPPSAWFESEAWPGRVLSDDAQNSVARSYGLSGFPFWAIVDADGMLVTRSAGGIGPDEFDSYLELARASS